MLKPNDPADLRDFAPSGVLDTPANRARRAAFFHSSQGRIMVELEDFPEKREEDLQPEYPIEINGTLVVGIILFVLALVAAVS